jgi:hypothetical protein
MEKQNFLAVSQLTHQKSKAHSANDQKGFTTITVLFLIIASTLFVLITEYLGAALLKNAAMFHCRSTLIGSQSQSQNLIQQLLLKNSESDLYHLNKDIAELEYLEAKLSGNPLMIAYARKKLLDANRQLQKLDAEQTSLIKRSDQILTTELQNTQKKIKNFFNTNALAKKISNNHFVIIKSNPKTAVTRTGKKPVAPNYKINKAISSMQEQTIYFKYNFKSFFSFKDLKLKSQEETCTVTTLKKRSNNLQVSANEAKY